MNDHTTDLFDRLRAACAEDWAAYVDHPFVVQLANGTLPERCFRHYLIQDYVFLIHFSRAWALAVYKADNLADMRAAAGVLHGLMDHEMALHVSYCESWGIGPEQLERTAEARANMAYTRYVLERGLAGDALDLLVALAPCVLGYAEIGRARIDHPDTRLEDNPYRAWLELYADREMQQLAASVAGQMQRLANQRMGEGRFEQLARTFADATRLEIGFWDMGLNRET
jgi:thiaminase (transcriptional activator TenA)